MDLLPSALIVRQRMQQTRLRNAQEYEGTQRPVQQRTGTGRAVRRGLGHALIAAGTMLLWRAEPLPASAPQPIQRA